MTKTEMALLLTKAAAFDQRTIGDADVEAWHECVGDLDFVKAMSAVTGWYRHRTERLMPATLRQTIIDGGEPKDRDRYGMTQDDYDMSTPWEGKPL